MSTAAARYDVVVVGGGMAGVAAAIAAAEAGAHTLLVERSAVLGGNATIAMVHSFCGLYLPATTAEPVYAHVGFPQRLAEGLRRAGGAGNAERSGKVFVLPTFPHIIEAYVLRLCNAVAELECRLAAEVVAAQLPLDRGDARLTLAHANGQAQDVLAGVVIDTSGDATVGALGGAECEQAAPEQLQSPSYIFRLAGVDTSGWQGYARLRLTYAVAHGVKDGVLPAGCESVLIRPGASVGDAYLTLNMPKLHGQTYDPLDPAYLAELEKVAQARANDLVRFLRAERPEFAAATVAAWPRRIGIRETRRLRGRTMLTANDILSGRRDADEVAVSTWPIELWPDHRRAEFQYAEGPSSIPLSALNSRSHARLGMAGRCLSATHEALGAVRVLGTAMATGEAIGIAAAMAADSNGSLWDVSAERVRAAIVARAARRD